MAAKKSAGAQASGKTVKVKALVPIEHDQVPYDVDKEFDLPEEAVAPLRDVEAIEVLSAATTKE